LAAARILRVQLPAKKVPVRAGRRKPFPVVAFGASGFVEVEKKLGPLMPWESTSDDSPATARFAVPAAFQPDWGLNSNSDVATSSSAARNWLPEASAPTQKNDRGPWTTLAAATEPLGAERAAAPKRAVRAWGATVALGAEMFAAAGLRTTGAAATVPKGAEMFAAADLRPTGAAATVPKGAEMFAAPWTRTTVLAAIAAEPVPAIAAAAGFLVTPPTGATVAPARMPT
jgi:hypothetical protein